MNEEKEKRIVKTGKEAKDAIRKAVKFVGDIVSSTLGPAGSNALLDRGRQDRAPLNTNDGVTIAEELALDDPCEHEVVKTIVEVAKQTGKDAGDGTTTSITIAHRLIDDCLDELGDPDFQGNYSVPVIDITRRIEEEKKKALVLLQKKVKQIETLDQLKDVAFVSLEDRKVGDIVAEAVWTVGKDGFATVDNGFHGKVEAETTPGIKFFGKCAASFMHTNQKKEAVFENIPVLVTNYSFQTMGTILKFLDSMNKEVPNRYNAVAILGSKFEAEAIKQVYNTVVAAQRQGKTPFRALLVKIPSLTEEELENVAAYVDGKFFNADTKTGETPDKARWRDAGFCEKIIVGEDETVIIGGRGVTQMIDMKSQDGKSYTLTRVGQRIEALKEKMTVEDDEFFRKKVENWIGKLQGGVSVIRVGAKTEVEAPYLKLKVEDAINSCKAALQMGVVKGAGIALSEVADELGDKSVLYNALKAPYEKIQSNAGGFLEIKDFVVDPLKVVSAALENACSVAKILITNNTIIAIPREDGAAKLAELLKS